MVTGKMYGYARSVLEEQGLNRQLDTRSGGVADDMVFADKRVGKTERRNTSSYSTLRGTTWSWLLGSKVVLAST